MTNSDISRNLLIKLYQVTCFMPFVIAFLHIAFAIENIIVLGSVIYFPIPSSTLRDEMWSYHFEFYQALGNVAIYLALMWVLVYLLVLITADGQRTKIATRLGCIGWVCIFIILFFIDPFGFMKYLID